MIVEIAGFVNAGDPITGERMGDMKVRKVVRFPDGTIYARYGLSWITGEWIEVPPDGSYPPETIMNDELRERLKEA
jgi:hypothetical protein